MTEETMFGRISPAASYYASIAFRFLSELPRSESWRVGDLTLFLKHHIAIQEGPTLCARELNADPAERGQHNHELTNEDLLAFATVRADEEARKAEVRRKANLHRRLPFHPTPEMPNS